MDYYQILETIPGDKAFSPLSDSNVPCCGRITAAAAD
jgi:hypothetical protein